MTIDTKRPNDTVDANENPAKRVKLCDPTEISPAVIKKQIEYYFSDENLAGDKMFYEKIKEDKDGFLPIDLILGCNKIKQMRISAETIFKAIEGSDKVEGKDLNALRRKGNKELPAFSGIRPGMKPRQQKINANLNTQSRGVVLEVKDLPSSLEFGPVKAALKSALEKEEGHSANLARKVNFCSMKKNNSVFITVFPFADNLKIFRENVTSLTVKEEKEEGSTEEPKEHKLLVSILLGKQMDDALKGLPQRANDDLKKAQRNFTHSLAKNRKLIRIANMNFGTVMDIKKKIREIQAVRGNGEELKQGGSDYTLIMEILKYHPTAPKKMENMSGIKVDESSFGGTRCFYVLKKDGTSEDFSVTKALAALEANPPYLEAKKEEKKEDKMAIDTKRPNDTVDANENPAKRVKLCDPTEISPAVKEANGEKKEEEKKEEKAKTE